MNPKPNPTRIAGSMAERKNLLQRLKQQRKSQKKQKGAQALAGRVNKYANTGQFGGKSQTSAYRAKQSRDRDERVQEGLVRSEMQKSGISREEAVKRIAAREQAAQRIKNIRAAIENKKKAIGELERSTEYAKDRVSSMWAPSYDKADYSRTQQANALKIARIRLEISALESQLR